MVRKYASLKHDSGFRPPAWNLEQVFLLQPRAKQNIVSGLGKRKLKDGVIYAHI